ncbi:hypothetical protein LCGC14_2402030 [marine sediment metagenome]|uniref:IFT52 GIFT domain-containing protein n=1 Tax=marine sediment metagenome TaxID=412755 RepID=A0A0F9BV37_9ZZZZ
MPYHIAFDISHKPRGKIDENLTELRDYLNSNDFLCHNLLEVPLTEESLMPYDILVFVCPDFTRISSHEITAIVNWVKNFGGGLLLLSHAGGDRGRGSNLNEISEQFGISFENDQVLDETNNLGLENVPRISTFNIPHPITSEIDVLCYRSGCSLSIIGSGAFSIADSNETSEPFSCPLICVSESGKGRVCCIGSYEMFRDNIGGGFQCKEHPKLTLNVFQWLVSDYRMELRRNADLPVPTPQTYNDTTPLSKQQIYSTDSIQIDKKSKDVGFSLKISNKSELIELLKNLQSQINNSKIIIDRLVEIALTSEDEITEQEETKLTTLPPKPESLKKVTVETNSELSLKPAPKLKTKSKTPKELRDEKQGLETKLSSVEDLMKFVDKKHSSGKINDDDYKKQSKKLQNNFKKTKKKIGIIKKLLEK